MNKQLTRAGAVALLSGVGLVASAGVGAAWDTAAGVTVTASDACSTGSIPATATVVGTKNDAGFGLGEISAPGATSVTPSSTLIDAGPTPSSATIQLVYPAADAGKSETVSVVVNGWYSNSSLTGKPLDSGKYTYTSPPFTLSDACPPPTTTTVPPVTPPTTPPVAPPVTPPAPVVTPPAPVVPAAPPAPVVPVPVKVTG